MNRPHNPAQHPNELAYLAHLPGQDAGWCDEHGNPAPWPDDFFDPDSDWRPTTTHTPSKLAPGEPPF